jgi:hypothetical protein
MTNCYPKILNQTRKIKQNNILMNVRIIEDEQLAARRPESMILSYVPKMVLAKLESVEDSVNYKWLGE